VADDLGINVETLHDWRAKHREDGEEAFPGSGKQIGAKARIAELEKKVNKLETERDMLKEAQEYPCIESHDDEFPVKTMCQVLDVSTSGYCRMAGPRAESTREGG